MKQLYTRWGTELDPGCVLPEYPRPLMVRDSYINLNGYWDYAFTKEFRVPEIYDGKNPTSSRGCFAQAWSVGELLRVYEKIEEK